LLSFSNNRTIYVIGSRCHCPLRSVCRGRKPMINLSCCYCIPGTGSADISGNSPSIQWLMSQADPIATKMEDNPLKINKLLVVLVICLFAFNSPAAIYKFVDEDGNLHFTDDLNQVPPDQRESIETSQEYEGEMEAEPSDAQAESEHSAATEQAVESEQNEETDPELQSSYSDEPMDAQEESEEEEIPAEVEADNSQAVSNIDQSGEDLDASRRQLEAVKKELDNEYQAILNEKQALVKQKDSLKTREDILKYNARVEALNKRSQTYTEKGKQYKKQVEDYNEMVNERNATILQKQQQ
jgi:hypothetical protein